VPKRSDQRIRRNQEDIPVDKVAAIGTVPIPDLAIDNPHPLVVDLYESMKVSAQKKYFEPTDWQVARLTMLALNQELTAVYTSGKNEGKPRPLSAVKLQVIIQLMAQLLLTEGERRRARIEIERASEGGNEGKVLNVADLFKQKLAEG